MKILFENNLVCVSMNSSDEVFITNKQDERTQIRVTPCTRKVLWISCHDGTLVPASYNGLSAIRVVGGHPK